jgi:hypothetical protein
VKRREEAATMNRLEEAGTEAEPAEDEPESAEAAEPAMPPIDEDVSGSVNAALHDADE